MTPRLVVVTIPAGQAVDVFAAASAPERRWFRNRGPGAATRATGADASSTSPSLPAGERHDAPWRTTLRLSVYSAAGTTIEGEAWS